MNIYADKGHKVRYIGISDSALNYRGDNPRRKFSEGEIYTVEWTKPKSDYTYVCINGFRGKYNSVAFEDVDHQVVTKIHDIGSFTLRDNIRGVLLGMVAGEKNGGPTCMALELATSLITCGHFNPKDVFKRYLDWWQIDGFDAGTISSQVLSMVADGVPHSLAISQIHDANDSHTGGCNPAHRSVPLAMTSYVTDNQLAGMAKLDAEITHFDPIAGDVAAATVVLCRMLIRGKSWPEALTIAAVNRMPETVSALMYSDESDLSCSGYSPDVLKAAVYFVGAHDSFGEALEASILFAGSDNYCPVLVGAIGGARWGASSIPEKHFGHCDKLDRVTAMAEGLANMW